MIFKIAVLVLLFLILVNTWKIRYVSRTSKRTNDAISFMVRYYIKNVSTLEKDGKGDPNLPDPTGPADNTPEELTGP